MPHVRSQFAWHNWTWARDQWYSTAHSKPGMKFVEVLVVLAHDLKAMAKGKIIHYDREEQTGLHSHSARLAAVHACKEGIITLEQLSKAQER